MLGFHAALCLNDGLDPALNGAYRAAVIARSDRDEEIHFSSQDGLLRLHSKKKKEQGG